MMVVLTVAVQFLLSLLVSLIAPQAAGLPVTSWLLAMVPLYLVAIPVCDKDDAGAAEHAALPE